MVKANISVLLNKEVFCQSIYCVVKAEVLDRRYVPLLYIPCRVMPSFQEIMGYFNTSQRCASNIRIPIAPNLKEFNANLLSAYRQSNFFKNESFHFCFQRNQVRKVFMSSSLSFLNSGLF